MFQTELVIPCYLIHLFLNVVILFVDWELINALHEQILTVVIVNKLFWVEIFQISFSFILLCFKVCLRIQRKIKIQVVYKH